VIGNFVKNWLLANGGWSQDKVNSIVITFEDESSPTNESGAILRIQ
jgi:hypothetical protein